MFLVGYYGSGNAGDEWLLQTLVNFVRAQAPERRIYAAVSGDVALPEGVEPVPLHDVYAVATAVSAASVVAMGGGGLLQDKGRADPWQVFHDPPSGVAAYLRPVILGRWYGRRTVMLGNGVGPIRTDAGRALVRAAVLHLDAMTVRDEASKALLLELGASPNAVEVGADLAWWRREIAPEPVSFSPRVVVNLRQTIAGLDEALVAAVAEALDRLAQRLAMPLVFAPFHASGRYGDLEVHERVAARMSTPLPRLEPSHPTDVFAVYRGAALSVGMRFHAAVGASLAGVPHIALAYDPKVEAVMQQLGAEAQCFSLDRLEPQALVAAAVQAMARGGPSPETIDELRAAAGRALAPLSAALETPGPQLAGPDPAEVASLSRNLQAAFQRYGRKPLPGIVRDLTKRVGELERENRELKERFRPRRILSAIRRRLVRS